MSSSVRLLCGDDGITNSGPGENLVDIYLLEETWSKMTEGQSCDEGLARLCADGLQGRGLRVRDLETMLEGETI